MLNEHNIMPFLAIIISSYLIGSLPVAYLIAKTRNVDIFKVGSGNMGGTNVARALGLGFGLLTAALDILKGVVAVLIARAILPDHSISASVVSGLVVIVGHNWSLFASVISAVSNGSRFVLKGGKGAAAAFGTLLTFAPIQTILGMVSLGVLLVLWKRYVSLGVLAAFAIAIVWIIVLVNQGRLPMEYTTYALLMGALIVLRFRENIDRLLKGTERRLGEPA
ncbi:MAG: glycerol-3-phosphate acyltransferase [Anaerolineae bacterium]|nr:glycerol-3-phosphate acyltransferase [Anaerolineae bacterium]MDW8171925.1 glycerol-3-phosphate acyltransferase [Anaerolineae bacterium]